MSRMDVRIHRSAEQAGQELAREVRDLLAQCRDEGRPAVLGLATGRTPLPFYAELIRLHREEGLSFRDVITFNLDEYLGLAGDHPESYRTFMHEHLFDHIDITPEHTHIPDGMVPAKHVAAHCEAYEMAIAEAGGIDLQILGIGRSGHIGFNEPGSSPESRTREVELDELTRTDAAPAFDGLENVPTSAITMGCGTILAAERLRLLAWGANKAKIVSKAFRGPVTPEVPASFLQEHENVRLLLDTPAAAELSPGS